MGRLAKHCFVWCVQRSATVAEPERLLEKAAVATTVLPKRALSESESENFHFPRFSLIAAHRRPPTAPHAIPSPLPPTPNAILPDFKAPKHHLSQPSGSRAFKSWQKEEAEPLVGSIKERADLMPGRPKDCPKQTKEEVFSTSLDDHFSGKKIQEKVRNRRAPSAPPPSLW